MKGIVQMKRITRFLIWLSFTGGIGLSGVMGVDAAPSEELRQVIEGAQKEGTVTVQLLSNFTQKSMSRLEQEIKGKFGVSLKIKFVPSMNFGKSLTKVIMENKAGAVPSEDLVSLSNHIARANEAGVVEQVEWSKILIEGTNPEVVLDTPLVRGGIVYFTGHLGLIYNPEKIKAGEVPRNMADLADPRWKNKGGVTGSQNSYVRWAFVLGKEKMFNALRDTLKNGVIQGRYPDLLNRYVLGEVSWILITSAFLKSAQDKGVPAAWQSLDLSDVSDFAAVVIKGAAHPNAAKLIALYLASPQGAKFVLEEGGAGNAYYPGNYEHDIRMQDRKQGIPESFGTRDTKILEFSVSKEGSNWIKEVRLMQQSGGTSGAGSKKKK
ncbi:MAG: substrate-binding domain-containing protein [Desulfobacterales bacterium]|nr:substrate-binding domain-containing protein [Desulfobacterales bacterium]